MLTHRSLIVSFTSFPARIGFVPQVLESLYQQSMQADRILLWLAEEQFPGKEDDLPEALRADIKAGKVEVRWCDELGSHKKYFYAMQEFPEDIVVTVDDDMAYHPDTIKVLYESYQRYPQAVSAIQASLILFEEEGNAMPPNAWLYDFRQLLEPTFQLMAIGVGGVLYPPRCLDERAFNKEAIMENLRIEDTYTSDDEWLKVHEAFAGTPVVLASDSILLHHMQGTQESALSKRSRYLEHSNAHFGAIRQHYACSGKDKVRECFQAFRQEANYLPDDARLCYELCTADLEQKIAVLTSDSFFGDSIESILPTYVRRNVVMMTRQMARDRVAGGEKEYVSRIRDALLAVKGIEDIAWRDITICAIIEHEAVLRPNMWGAHRSQEDYRQMLRNWERFMESHPDCRPVYREKYGLFLKDMESAGYAPDALADPQEANVHSQVPSTPQMHNSSQPAGSAPARISIIIPVHNAGSYVAKCIESLKAQTMRELEFIFVDDCSSDGSMGAVEEWASADPRVKILGNEHNLGEGGSRNRGLKAACGLYVNTIDPDDWVAPSYYELLWAKAADTAADVIKGTRIKIDEKTGKELKPRSRLNATIDASLAKGEPLYLNLHYEHTTIIFKRSLLDDTVRYGSSPHACDSTFLLRLCMNAESYAAEERACYFYLQREGGATAEYSLERSKNELISLQEQMDSILQKGSIDDYAYEYCAQRFYAYSARFVHAYEREKTSAQDKAQYVSDLKEQMLRLPAHENLYKIVPELYAIVELDMVPAPRLNTDISICKEEISGWMTYILAADATLERPAREKLEDLLVAYCKKRMKAGASQEVLKSETSYMRSGLAGLKARMIFHGIAKKALKKALSHGK